MTAPTKPPTIVDQVRALDAERAAVVELTDAAVTAMAELVAACVRYPATLDRALRAAALEREHVEFEYVGQPGNLDDTRCIILPGRPPLTLVGNLAGRLAAGVMREALALGGAYQTLPGITSLSPADIEEWRLES